MRERTLAQELALFADRARSEGVPPKVAHSVRQRILDVIGLSLAARALDTSEAVLSFVADQGGVAQAHVIGSADALPASQAAFANGVLAHSLDYDDTHLPSVLHPSACVVPAALAAAEAANAPDELLIGAIAVGLEIAVRLGMAGYDKELGNSVFFEHGQHATSICGAMGGAVAAGLLIGLDAEQLTDVLGVAASMASGIIEGNRTGGTVKRMHCGWAAHSALVAADLVKRGITGPPTVLEGRFGFFQAFLKGRADLDQITIDLGVVWSVPDIFFKPYPANHFTHTSVDAGLALHRRGIRPDDIVAIRLGLPTAVIRTVGEPIEAKRQPQTGYQAQFSGPFAVVAGLLGGGGGLGMGLSDYSAEKAQDPERRRLMSLVEVVPDPDCDEVFPYQFPAVVTVTLADGRTETEEVLTNRGGPARPLSDAELGVKFANCCAGRFSDAEIRDLSARVLSLGSPSPGAPPSTLTALMKCLSEASSMTLANPA
jgi:2-methylcitrate dehydratase PrpD